MKENSPLDELHSSGAVLRGHFSLSSGLRSDVYIQCALLLKNPRQAERFARLLVEAVPVELQENIDLVVAPALGGLIIGHEVARLLEKEFVFFEKYEGELSLRRGFKIGSGMNVLLVEDVVTTAGSSINVLQKVHRFGANIPVAASIIDRSKGLAKKRFQESNCSFFSIVELDCSIFDSANVPAELEDIPCVKLGSTG